MTTHLTHSGHISLDNGAVIRLDIELGRWTARFYRPDLSLLAYAYGPFEQMCATANLWADAFDASFAREESA